MTGKIREVVQVDCLVLRTPIIAIACMGALAMCSLIFNSPFYGSKVRDVFEIFKYFYQGLLMIITCFCTRRAGAMPTLGFVFGVLISGVIAYENPMNPDVLLGARQIFNPNVIGNVLAVSIALCSVLIIRGHALKGAILGACGAVISFFTFSKGTWLMTILAICGCGLALGTLRQRRPNMLSKPVKYIAYAVLGALLLVAYAHQELIVSVINAKITVTDFSASSEEGGSVSQRLGMMRSATYMFSGNPVFGVGISNFEQVNQSFQRELGSAFYDDDNPNSAWFYVLGCMGLPAFLFFGSIYFWFLRKLCQIAQIKTRLLYTGCIGGVFLIGGNVQLEMLTSYYYWIVLGVIGAYSLSTGSPTRTRKGNSPLAESSSGSPVPSPWPSSIEGLSL
jgi:hypothetical protein